MLPSIGAYFAAMSLFGLKMTLFAALAEVFGLEYKGLSFVKFSPEPPKTNRTATRTAFEQEVRDSFVYGDLVRGLLPLRDELFAMNRVLEGLKPTSTREDLETEADSALGLIQRFDREHCLESMLCSFAAGRNPEEQRFVSHASIFLRNFPELTVANKYRNAAETGYAQKSLMLCRLLFPCRSLKGHRVLKFVLEAGSRDGP